jgi:hypothetical protein
VPKGDQDSEPPRQVASVTPQDLYPTSDIRFVLVELGKVGTKLDRLIEDVGKQGDKLGTLETTVDRVRTGAIVGAVILSGAIGLFWWAIGDRISAAVRLALFPSTETHTPPAPPIPAPQVPLSQPMKR